MTSLQKPITGQIGYWGIVIGLIAIGIAIFQDDLRPAPPLKSSETSLKSLVTQVGKTLMKEKILKKKPTPQVPKVVKHLKKPYDTIGLTYMGLGFLAIILGFISWIRKDPIRISSGAVIVGLLAVAWHYVLMGVLIAIIISVLVNIGG